MVVEEQGNRLQVHDVASCRRLRKQRPYRWVVQEVLAGQQEVPSILQVHRVVREGHRQVAVESHRHRRSVWADGG